MSKLDTAIRVVGKINEFDKAVAFVTIVILGFPLIILFFMGKGIYESFKSKREKGRNREDSEKEELRQRIEAGEVRLRDLPHEHRPQLDLYSFEKVEHPRYERNILFYVNSEKDCAIRAFLNNEREWIEEWTWKYGFKIEMLKDQDSFLDQMCYPQDRVFLKHGFLRDLNYWTGDYDYRASVMPFKYYELEEGSIESLKQQMENLAQDIYEEQLI